MSPVTLLLNFLNNVVSQVTYLAWPLLILSVVIATIKGINDFRETGRWPIWSTIGFLVGGIILWYIVYYPTTVARWICGLMGLSCP